MYSLGNIRPANISRKRRQFHLTCKSRDRLWQQGISYNVTARKAVSYPFKEDSVSSGIESQ